jgi:hypothetical protein
MLLKTALVTFFSFVVVFGLTGCPFLGGNPTQGIGIMAKVCPQDPNSPPNVPKCLKNTDLIIQPYVKVWG